MFDRFNLWVASMVARTEREEGQAMVEYALILGLVSVVAIVTLGLIGTSVNDALVVIENAIDAVTP